MKVKCMYVHNSIQLITAAMYTTLLFNFEREQMNLCSVHQSNCVRENKKTHSNIIEPKTAEKK